jgi:tRNA pseudouridine38-40 synthase
MAYRYFIQLSYNGSAYCGWQKQPNAVSVQQWIERGLDSIAGVDAGVTGCGRTDAGVHAGTFFAHFDYGETLSAEALLQLVFRLNRFLPDDICVSRISPVVPGAHARFSATWREYEYLILRRKDPFNFQKAYMVHGELNVVSMNACAFMLIGKHDFESFSKVHTEVNNFLCTVQFANWSEDVHFLKFTIRADRFLRNMVRAIVGTLLDVGRGKISPDDFQNIMDSHNRGAAGYSVPAKGLTLTGIGYPEEIFAKEPVFFLPESGDKIISHYYTDPEFHKRTGDKPDK